VTSPPDLASFQWDCVVFVWDYSAIQWHVQHIHVHSRFMSSIQSLDFHFLGSWIERYVLRSHTDERFLLLYGKALLFMHVRFEIHIFGKPLAFKPT